MTITPTNQLPPSITPNSQINDPKPVKSLVYPVTIGAIAVTITGLIIDNIWLGLSGALVALLVSIPILWGSFKRSILSVLSPEQKAQILGILGVIFAMAAIIRYLELYDNLLNLGSHLQWDAIGSLAEWTGAVGQIFIAVLAVYIAWQQYVISRDLTIEQNRLTTQQNVITQQQTIDTYFQGISDLALDDKGFLEDWPQEQAFAEGRTAALLSSIDAPGKAKVLRFLSQSKLITPLQRDRRLGRPMLNGDGGYAEDRVYGVRVIDLGVMLAGADLAGTDLRWTDLSEANLVRANLSKCDLVKANFSRTILYEAKLSGADIKGARFHYGSVETASPRSRIHPPDYETGANTGAVVEDADFTNVQSISEEQRYYCCAWGGDATRATIPGGCAGIPNRLELARQIAHMKSQELGGKSDAQILSDRSII
jgi:uncharacterized protein YjbI with pentapeptide repeats